jgi:nucleoside-diphosphate-sugar epimerase
MTALENSPLDMVMNRILIIGGTGYIGKYMAKASVSLGYPTYILVRPATAAPDSFKAKLLQEFKDIGIHVLQVSEYSRLLPICSCDILRFLSYLDSNTTHYELQQKANGFK